MKFYGKRLLAREYLGRPTMTETDATMIITPLAEPRAAYGRWQPIVGPEARRLMDHKLPGPAGEPVLGAAVSILSRGTPPDAKHDQTTGLVVGYVQSGKTLSFTTVIALARDNGYRLIIVVAGTSKPLLEQSTQRLRHDLKIDDPDGHLRWASYTNPADNESNRRFIVQSLDEWRDPDVPDHEKATVLITVMKNHQHLTNLINLLRRLSLEGVRTLIVDDEADQASLNTGVNRGKQSPTYRRLLDLRDTMPCHLFLQYTATPQAPLLINIIDALSPDFVEVLDPGDNYVGGETFFGGRNDLVRVIPPQDVPTVDNPLSEPPPTLLEALRVFLIGVAAGVIQGVGVNNLNRSMLVHPSRETVQHMEYRVWIGRIFDEWQRILDLTENDADRQDLIQEFRDTYDDVRQTVPDLPAFDQIVRTLPRAFRKTSIEEVNARPGKTPSVDWRRAYGWILVGGQAMDRGFTVEGLTVTYMPRGPGVGNADTIQQRARFFGYKRPYLGFCRIYLEQGALTALEAYVAHEEEMRRQLEAVRDSGQHLSDWKRAFVLAPDLKPCRKNVIQYDYARGNYADAWFAPRTVLAPTAVLNDNRAVVQKFLGTLTFSPDSGSPQRKPAQRHDVSHVVSLRAAMETLLIHLRLIAAEDTQELTGLLLQLAHAIEENPHENCTVYRISPAFPRQRGVDASGRITNLFQGADPVIPPERRGSIYPGDRDIHGPDSVTIQVHFVELKNDSENVATNVPVVAVWVPARMAIPWIAQVQPR